MSASRHSNTSLWPVWPVLGVALAALACTPGTSIGTDDVITGHERSTARVTFRMTKALPTAANVSSIVDPKSVALPIRGIVLSGASGESPLYACPVASAHACEVDVADDAAVAALFQSPIDVAPGAYDTVLFRSASEADSTVAVALPAAITLTKGDVADIALPFAPAELQRSFAVAALLAPSYQAATR